MSARRTRKKDEAVAEPAEGILDKVFTGAEPVPEHTATLPLPEGAEAAPSVPDINSRDWTNFILSKLEPDELFDGCPTYEGLRRLAYEYLGDIVDVDVDVRQTPNAANGNHSCAVVRMVIDHPHDFYWLGSMAGRQARYSHAGDVFMGNPSSKDTFAWRFSSATCTTRVKGSLLRDVFRLRHTYTKEELSALTDAESGVNGTLQAVSVKVIDMMARRLNINAERYMLGVWKHYDEKGAGTDLNKMPRDIGGAAVKRIQPFQQKPETIPAVLVGYIEGWHEGLDCMRG